jgi:hypothetical protein
MTNLRSPDGKPYIIARFPDQERGETLTLPRLEAKQVAVLVRFDRLVPYKGRESPVYATVAYIIGHTPEDVSLKLATNTECVLVGLPDGVQTPLGAIALALEPPMNGGPPVSVID